MLQEVKTYARLFGLFFGALFLFVRLCFGFKLPEPGIVKECEPEPEPEPPPSKVHIDPMIMTVKDLVVPGQHTGNPFDLEVLKETMLRGAAYMRNSLLKANPTIEKLPVILTQYTYGRAVTVMVYVDFVPSKTDGLIPALDREQEAKLRHFGRVGRCFNN